MVFYFTTVPFPDPPSPSSPPPLLILLRLCFLLLLCRYWALDQMRSQGIPPTPTTYEHLVKLHGALGQPREACQVLQRMRRHGSAESRPTRALLLVLFDVCAKCDDVGLARQVMLQMKSRAMAVPDTYV